MLGHTGLHAVMLLDIPSDVIKAKKGIQTIIPGLALRNHEGQPYTKLRDIHVEELSD